MKEVDIAKLVIEWLKNQHWEVYQEVQFVSLGAVADIVAVRNNYLWIIEVKKSLSLTVMEQAYIWRSHFRSIAIPSAQKRRGNLPYKIAKNYLKIGVIEISKHNYVHSRIDPPLMREYNKFANKMINELQPEQKHYAEAGTNKRGHFTPYKRTMDGIKKFIAKNPGCSLKEIMDHNGKGHYQTNASARTSIRVALENWESAWCKIEKVNGKNLYFVLDAIKT